MYAYVPQAAPDERAARAASPRCIAPQATRCTAVESPTNGAQIT